MERYDKIYGRILDQCVNIELTFIIAASIAFYCSGDAWEVWDILQYIEIDENALKNTAEVSGMVEQFLKSPGAMLDKYQDNGVTLVHDVKRLVGFWKDNEFDFDVPTRILASRMINDIANLAANDIKPALYCLKKRMNRIKEQEGDVAWDIIRN